MQAKQIYIAATAIFLAFWLLSAVLPVHAQTFTVLHTFTGAPNDGEGPFGIVIRDSAANLYGTTSSGGKGKWDGTGTCGTGFVLNKAGKEIAHLNFGLGIGCVPMAGLLRDLEGNFFGTTLLGGNTNCYEYGCGTVYKVSKAGKETMLHEFTGSPDGEEPEALLVQDAAGNIYGTAYLGGVYNFGAVFKIDITGKETILHSFAGPLDGGGDGVYPYAGVILDAEGNLYGATAGGGTYGAGTVYELDSAGNETLLYSFTGESDGASPSSVLLFDPQGNLYGTTRRGGNLNCEGGDGCGVVFELSPQQDGSWTDATLYTFCSVSNCTDGQEPIAGPLVRDTTGNLYGTTYFGGAYRNCNGDGCGAVFKLDTNEKETVLHSFTGGSDGAFPWAGLTMDGSGNLYGTATAGGDAQCLPPSGCGTVFKLTL